MTTLKTCFPLILILTLSALGCATTTTSPPEPLSDAATKLIDPSTGFSGGSASSLESSRRAWQAFQTGQLAGAEQIWQQILVIDPEFDPALVGLASVAVARNQYERAGELNAGIEPYTAATVLQAELLAREGHVVEAAQALRALSSRPETPSSVFARFEELRQEAVARLLSDAGMAADAETRLGTLRRAVDLAPQDRDLRLRFVDELIASGRYSDARAVLQPTLEQDAPLNRVQAALAEIEIGEGNYQGAMRRYERVVQRTGDVVYAERLEHTKRLWHESTFPERFQLATRSPNITREQLAVLFFWKLPSIRFAQNLRQPPIVVDIAEVMGREELIRALSIGLLAADRTTRTARPRRTVTAGEFLRAAATALDFVSTDPCVSASGELEERLHACGIDTMGLEREPDGFVSGATASAILNQISALDRSAE